MKDGLYWAFRKDGQGEPIPLWSSNGRLLAPGSTVRLNPEMFTDYAFRGPLKPPERTGNRVDYTLYDESGEKIGHILSYGQSSGKADVLFSETGRRKFIDGESIERRDGRFVYAHAE